MNTQTKPYNNEKSDSELARRIGSGAFGALQSFLRKAPAAGRKSRFNWAVRQTRQRLRESGRLPKWLDAELLSIRK